jgi:1-acyl-sn-glycerol-3-phosphate acyltransferase
VSGVEANSGARASAERVLTAALYGLGRGVSAAALGTLARPRLEGRHHVPLTGPLLVVANHCSMWDPPLLAVLMPRRMAYLTKAELFRPAIWGWALQAAGMIPVRRGHPERRVLDAALGVLAAGGALVVFAEGTRSRNGVLAAAEAGVGLLAVRSGAPVLPTAILGTERLRSQRALLARPRLVVRCGPVLRPEPTGRGAAAYRQVADAIMARVAALLPPERRGPYAAALAAPAAAARPPDLVEG